MIETTIVGWNGTSEFPNSCWATRLTNSLGSPTRSRSSLSGQIGKEAAKSGSGGQLVRGVP